MFLRASLLTLAIMLAAVVGVLNAGCGDDVKVVRQSEEMYESPARPVAPGEPIVE